MSGRAVRPRRSEPKSYVDLFKPMDLGSSSSSSSDTEPEAAGDASGPPGSSSKSKSDAGKKQKKRRSRIFLPSDDDDSDISEYEETPKDAQGGKQGAAAAGSSSDDDDLGASAVETEDSDGPGEEPEYEGDYAGGEGSRSPEPGGGGGGRRRKGHQGLVHDDAPRPKYTRAHLATPTAAIKIKPLNTRVAPPLSLPPTLVEFPFSAVFPQYEPPVRKLVKGAKSVLRGKVEQRDKEADDGMRMRCLEAWSTNAFGGPEKSLLQDMGWWKGKWVEGRGLAGRWGGWYDEVETAELGPALDEDAVAPHLPQLVFSSVPTKIDLAKELFGDEAASDKGVTPPVEDEPVDEEEENEDAATHQRESIKIWLGSVAEGQEQQRVDLGRFESRRLDEFLPRKPGFILNAGGAVLGLDWCPLPDPPKMTEYLAVGTCSNPSASISHDTSPGPSMIQIWSLDMSVAADFSIATDETESGAGPRLELGLCINEGDAWELKWCPRGGNTESSDAMEVDGVEEDGRLGILAGAFADGTVSLFAVPHPVGARRAAGTIDGVPLYVQAKPILKLTLPDTTCSCIAWSSHETLAAGCNNGYVAMWDVGSALRSGASTARPLQYFPVHTASVRELAFLRTPPLSRDLDGSLDADAEPTYLSSVGYDGSALLVDLSDYPAPMILNHDRGVLSSIAWSPHLGSIISHDADNVVRVILIRARDFSVSRSVVKLNGAPRSIATSDHHPWLAAAGADGACCISNSVRAVRKKPPKGYYVQRAFRLDFNRRLGEYRMLDDIKIEDASGIEATLRIPTVGKAGAGKSDYIASAGAWPAEVALSRVTWHPALNRACLLATGTVSGVVRLDWIEGGEGFAAT